MKRMYLVLALLMLSQASDARWQHRAGHSRCYVCSHRSYSVRHAFIASHPCPSTGKSYGRCPGWIVDHVKALKHGGADASWNLQWQTRSAAKAKDRWE